MKVLRTIARDANSVTHCFNLNLIELTKDSILTKNYSKKKLTAPKAQHEPQFP